MKREIKIVEVGPRDGLQNLKTLISPAHRVQLIEKLYAAGIKTIEVGSFVSPKWVPQMEHSDKVYDQVKHLDANLPILVPNEKGMETALQNGVKEIAVFTAVSETFCQRNIGCSIEESLNRYRKIIQIAKKNRIKVRGYISCVMGCPYEGGISLPLLKDIALELIQMGCYEISLGDTIGIGTIDQTKMMIEELSSQIPVKQIACHFHDTYGQALVNIATAINMGVEVVDSSIGGLGGCPYAKGASGNVATEDVIYMLEGMGLSTNIDLKQLTKVSRWCQNVLGLSLSSKLPLTSYAAN